MSIKVNDKCVGCALCIKACPFGAITIVEKKAVIGDACTLCGACAQACKFGAIEIERKKATGADLSQYKGIWIFAETEEGKLKNVAFELLGKARELAKELGQEVGALLLGNGVKPLAAELAKYGADKVYVAEHPLLEEYSTDAYSNIIVGLISKHMPNIVLYPATKVGRDIAPRIAAALDLGLTADCTGLSIKDGLLLQTRPAFGGNVMADILCPITRPQMATVRPNVFKIREPEIENRESRTESRESRTPNPEIIEVHVKLEQSAIRTVIKQKIKSEATGAKKIDEVDVIVSGGRGMECKENFAMLQEIAELFGGAVGASRVAVENHWMPKSHQVGQSGTTVSPKIYFACGISGTIQHLVGMSGSKAIIAINKDPQAPIFNFADYGIVGDVKEVLPRLKEELKKTMKK